MPLKSGYSRESVAHNVALMRSEGRPEDQAVAASLEHGRADYFKRYPQGFLPVHLKLPNGKRDRASWDKYKRNPCACRSTNPSPRPTLQSMAAELVSTYRTKGEAATQRLFDALSKRNDLMKRDEKKLEAEFNRQLNGRRPNPVPESSRSKKHDRQARVAAASRIYTEFTGHDAHDVVEIDKPEFPDTMAVIGDIDGILYTTVRDGITEKYIHKFKKNCRPLFCVSPDGKQLFMLGGSYDFTERGIVDRS